MTDHSLSIPIDSDKMETSSDTTSSSSPSISVPIQQTNLDLEKTTSTGTCRTNQSRNSNRVVRTAQDWDGPDDPDNPLNWSTKKKAYHTLVPALQAFTITFGSSVYSPSIPQVARHFDIGSTTAILPLTVYVLGLGAGPMLSAPISETWGRRSVYLWFFPPSLLLTMGAGFSNTFAGLVICRFLAGLTGSGTLAVGAGSNSDLYAPINRAMSSSIFLMAPFLGPALGPALGGYVSMKKDWRWTQWLILFWGALTYALTVPQKETYKRIILSKRARRLNIQGPPSLLPPGMSMMRFVFVVTILRPLRMLITESIVAFFSIYTAFNFSVLFAFFAAFPVVFSSPYPEIQIYHFNTGESGLVFLAIGLGVVISTMTFIVFDLYTYRPQTLRKRATGDFTPLPPEARLQPAMLGSVLLPISLFWFGWTARSDIHWIVPVMATVLFGVGNLLVFCSCILYSIDTYGPLAGASAAAANGLLRYTAGAVFPLFTIQMYRAMGVGWATSMLGFITVALLPVPWVLHRYGPHIRKRSAFAPVA
ncbi:hypothetical protein PV10_00076 [Exophiala mesophila]|uniref:Major facilitator superfamily (MFS) profile domain-containing protein n=1 Tax=Exophiala mesophila TaxID=212818 RepID=A0A0D1ZNG4_EXOME|nr:uncharacterized protein PV10_00076 [Exophiala mesophila]KIV96177.1 hypothetical protein PV10_00076 [Exophiala mesophila]